MIAALPVISSLGDNMKLELERLKKEKSWIFALSPGSFFSPLKHLPVSLIICSHYTHFFFSHFPLLKHLPILSYTYKAIIPIYLTFFLHSNIFSFFLIRMHSPNPFFIYFFFLSLFPLLKYLPTLFHTRATRISILFLHILTSKFNVPNFQFLNLIFKTSILN